MRNVAINGTSFVGKTTLIHHLQMARLKAKCAFMDGDDVARVSPFELSLDWLNLVQDNIASCAENFDKLGLDAFFFAFPFPNHDRMSRLEEQFSKRGYRLEWIHLVVADHELEKRFRLRNGTVPHKLQLGLDMNASIKAIPDSIQIDTTNLTIAESAQIVLNHLGIE
jgi:hypothetical protein